MQANFLYFEVMNTIFTEYAESQLNSSLNKTTQEEVSAFVGDLLENSSFNIDVLRCATSDLNELPAKPAIARQSEAAKVRQYIAKLPRDSISVSQASLKVMHNNTPFNRKYQLSTIVNHRNNLISTFKRSHVSSTTSFSPKPKKTRLAFHADENINEPQNITTIESFDETCIDKKCKVESLDDCNISGIQEQALAIAMEPVKFAPKISKKFDCKRITNRLGNAQFSGNPPKVKKSLESTPARTRNISTFQLFRQVPDQSSSVLEIPSLPSINILEIETLPSMTSIVTPSTYETRQADPDVRDIAKKLIWSESTTDIRTVNYLNQPPQWFQSFLDRYSSDMRVINTKMDSITKKLDKIIEQTSFD